MNWIVRLVLLFRRLLGLRVNRYGRVGRASFAKRKALVNAIDQRKELNPNSVRVILPATIARTIGVWSIAEMPERSRRPHLSKKTKALSGYKKQVAEFEELMKKRM